MERNEILKMINSNPDKLMRANGNLYHHKTFAIVAYGGVENFYKTKRGAKGQIKRDSLVSYYDDYSKDMCNCGSGKTVMEIKETELCDINDKGVWYRHMEHLFRKNWLQTNDTVWEVKKYCRNNQDTINFVTELTKKIKDSNYSNMPIYKEYEYKKQVEEVKEEQTETTTEVTNNTDKTTINFNKQHNGIEIKFNFELTDEQQKELRPNGFRWSYKQKFYYAKDNKQTREFLINRGYLVVNEENKEQNEEVKTIETEIKPVNKITFATKNYKNEVLNAININPYFLSEAHKHIQNDKTFAIILTYDNSINKFLSTRELLEKEYTSLKECYGNIIVAEINKNELYNINDKNLWINYINSLIKEGYHLDNTTVQVEKYCTNKDTINFVKDIINRKNEIKTTSEPTKKFDRVAILKDVNLQPRLIDEAKNNMCDGKAFGVMIGGLLEFHSYRGDQIIEVKESELDDINSKAVWYRYIKDMFENGLIRINNTVEEAEDYCTNKDTINFVKDLINQIENSNYSILPTYKELTETKVIEQIPEVSKESDILNNIKTVALNPDKYVFILAAKDIKDKRSLINRCCITTLKIVNDEQFNYIINNSDKNLFEIEEDKQILNKKENEYENSILIYNKDKHQVKVILNNKVLQFFENRQGSIVNLVKPYKLAKKKTNKVEIKESNCIILEVEPIENINEKINYSDLTDKVINSLLNHDTFLTAVNSICKDEKDSKDYIQLIKDDFIEIKEKTFKTLNKFSNENNKIELFNYLTTFYTDYIKNIVNKINIAVKNGNNGICSNTLIGVSEEVQKQYKNTIEKETELKNNIRTKTFHIFIKDKKDPVKETNTDVEPEKIVNEENKKDTVKTIVKEVTEPIKKDYESLINTDIENYNIKKDLNSRVNSVAFITNDRDYNKELKGFLNGCKDEVLKVINMTNDIDMKEKALNYILYFNSKYYNNYTKILNHKANNPSWVVTGRGGLNRRKYNKALSRYDNLLLDNNNLIDTFNSKISSFRTKIKRAKRQAINNKIDSFTMNNNTKLKFEKIKIKINRGCVYNVFNNATSETLAYKYDNYYIIKNWGNWKIYNNEGNEINTTRTNATLKAAKDYLTYIIKNVA